MGAGEEWRTARDPFWLAHYYNRVITYALLHIQKPFLEALASVIAGLVPWFLALKSRSIWPGIVVRCGVAFSMDLFALIRAGRFELLY